MCVTKMTEEKHILILKCVTKTTEEKCMLILKIHSRNGNMGRVLLIHYDGRKDGGSTQDEKRDWGWSAGEE